MKYRRVKVETDVVNNGQLLLLEEAPYSYEGEDLPFYENPETDEQRLMTAQHDFLLFNSTKAWQELWTLTITVAGRAIAAERKKKKFYLSADDKADKQIDAAEYLLRRYKTIRGYFVRGNFIAAIIDSVRHVLYYQSESDKLVDFVSIEKLETMPVLPKTAERKRKKTELVEGDRAAGQLALELDLPAETFKE
ncbi:MAG: hypothetical protein ACTTKX_02165 [Treponema sp.]